MKKVLLIASVFVLTLGISFAQPSGGDGDPGFDTLLMPIMNIL